MVSSLAPVTTKDVDGPDWHLTEYAATARIGRAWYFLDPDCGPQQQRWHARSRAGCGLAATYAKAADSKFRACTCSAAVETLQHVYLRCPHYAAARTVLVAAWAPGARPAMRFRDELHGEYSHDDALGFMHSDEWAPDPGWCPAHVALRRAAL
jgi:hypothetical protein